MLTQDDGVVYKIALEEHFPAKPLLRFDSQCGIVSGGPIPSRQQSHYRSIDVP
jgi:hypothetical protein